MQNAIKADELPGILAEVAKLLNVGVALKIAAAHGGKHMHIPRSERLPETHALVRTVGWDAAVVICANFGGEQWLWPSAVTVRRHAEARQLRSQGLTCAEIGDRLGISTRRVSFLTADVAPPRRGRLRRQPAELLPPDDDLAGRIEQIRALELQLEQLRAGIPVGCC